MVKKKNNGALPRDVLKEFDENLQPNITAVWNKSDSAQKPAISFTPEEIEEALERVHSRLDAEPGEKSYGNKTAGRVLSYSRYTIAAVALIVATALFFLVPKTATVPYGEMATLELRDGSLVEMNSGTTIRYSRLYPYINRSIEINGEAFFSVESHNNPFIVEANGAMVEVTGTRFNVRSWSDEPSGQTTVSVTNGEVQFYPLHKNVPPVTLTVGNTSTWNPGMAEPAKPEPVALEDVLAWREQRFVFRDQPLISILMELERRYNTIIELDAPEVEQNTLTAYYSKPSSIESVLDDICTVKGLRYTQTNNGYRVFR